MLSAIFGLEKSVEKIVCIKLCEKIEISSPGALKMLQKYFVDERWLKLQVFKYYKSFREGFEAVEEEFSSGRPLRSNPDKKFNKTKELALSNRRLTHRDLVGMSERSLQTRLNDNLS